MLLDSSNPHRRKMQVGDGTPETPVIDGGSMIDIHGNPINVSTMIASEGNIRANAQQNGSKHTSTKSDPNLNPAAYTQNGAKTGNRQ